MLGNEEADRRYQNTIEALKQPDINYISVKISGIYAQTHALNYEESFPELVRRMSEGIDYCRFYTTSMKKFYALDDVDIKAKGTVLVISPWNFPCAIPCGGVVAGLASGNTVILKPASVAAPVAWLFAKAFWDAGVPKEALQVVITERDALPKLTQAPEIKHIILTGGTDTAQQILRAKPRTPLSAETGGKNVIIITASADMDHGIMCACHSAFGNAGQKCSACSLLLVERSVYNRPDFREKLRDCATSLKVGGVWNAGNIVGPMITNHNEKLLKAIEKLEPGEEWLVRPHFVDKNHYILAPTVKLGVRPENYYCQPSAFRWHEALSLRPRHQGRWTQLLSAVHRHHR